MTLKRQVSHRIAAQRSPFCLVSMQRTDGDELGGNKAQYPEASIQCATYATRVQLTAPELLLTWSPSRTRSALHVAAKKNEKRSPQACVVPPRPYDAPAPRAYLAPQLFFILGRPNVSPLGHRPPTSPEYLSATKTTQTGGHCLISFERHEDYLPDPSCNLGLIHMKRP